MRINRLNRPIKTTDKTIYLEREYGSGGTKIARLLAEQTGIACYGHEILEEVSKENNLSVDKIESYEEKATNSFMYSVYMIAQASSGKADMLTNGGHIYVAEQAVIRRLAKLGPSVFLGHCASEALKEQSGVVNVFIRCTDEAAKKKRITEDYGIDAVQADAVGRRFDKKRANYYYINTAKKWDDLRNYDIVLDSGVIGINGCVAVLRGLLNEGLSDREA